jgi:hypothetical protein
MRSAGILLATILETTPVFQYHLSSDLVQQDVVH